MSDTTDLILITRCTTAARASFESQGQHAATASVA